MIPQDLIDLCKDKKDIWIQTHNFPDPDAISAAFGLQEIFRHFGIKANICHEGRIDKLSSVKLLKLCDIELHDAENKKIMTGEASIVLVDCQKGNANITDLSGKEIAVVDHHPTVVEIQYEYKDVRMVGACASIIASYFKQLNIRPSKKAATALIYGLHMDTLDFTRGVTAFDVDMFRYLFDYMDADLFRKLKTNNIEYKDLSAYGTAIENIKTYGKVAFSYVDFMCPDAMVAILADFILSLTEIEVAIVFAKRGDGYKFSFRSERKNVDAGILARECLNGMGDGGGHSSMAGGFVSSSVVDPIGGDKFTVIQEHCIDVIEKKWPDIL